MHSEGPVYVGWMVSPRVGMHELNHLLRRGSFRQNWVSVMGSCPSGDGGRGVEVKCHLKKREQYMPKCRGLKQQSCHGNTSSYGGVQGSMCGVGDVGQQKMRLKRSTAEALSCGNGELLEDYQQRKGFQ